MKVLYFCLIALLFYSSVVLGKTKKFSATINGEQQVPTAVASTGEGSGSFFLHEDDDNNFEWIIEIEGLDINNLTGCHFHEGRIGTNGDVMFEITMTSDDSGTEITSEGDRHVSSDQARHIKNGHWYVNCHTTENEGGEVRGQVLTIAERFQAKLKGDKEVPAVDTKKKGEAKFKIDYNLLELEYEITHDINGVVGAHIHGPADSGENSDPFIVFEDPSSPIKGVHQLTTEHMNFIRAGLAYVNIHSQEHENGEIRGQVEESSEESSTDPYSHDYVFDIAIGVILVLIGLAVIGGILAGFLVYRKRTKIFSFARKKNSFGKNTLSDSLLEEDNA
eukprot:TRINITY_DN4998_c6_g1_i1.p1 TRINITY_DN4998_c6_g1~~TRINITY_DN4998_c6_g1_i1.p1  ORF type:complete len:353 (+),score=127.30 TRINITY_DN4998_c6_g1_i1:58-1059(+)